MIERLFRKQACVIVVVELLFAASMFSIAVTAFPGEEELDEYPVWTAAIKDVLEKEFHPDQKIQRIVIEDHTTDFPDYEERSLRAVARERGLPEEVVLNFMKVNKAKRKLERRFELPLGVNLLSQELEHYFFKEHKLDRTGWDLFYKAFPKSQGLMGLSSVAFYDNNERALVYVWNQRYWLGGAGYLIFLRREGPEWKVEDRTMIWIS
jgi:hypothetical protein